MYVVVFEYCFFLLFINDDAATIISTTQRYRFNNIAPLFTTCSKVFSRDCDPGRVVGITFIPFTTCAWLIKEF